MPLNIFGGDGNGIVNKDIDANGFRIINLGDPENSKDAVNKKYVDSKFQAKEPWLLEGNNLLAEGMLGSLNNINFSIVRNNIQQIQLIPSVISLNSDTVLTNPTGDETGEEDPPGEIESNAGNFRLFGVQSLGRSKEFRVLLGNLYNYIAWQNLNLQQIRIVTTNGCMIKKGSSNLFQFGDINKSFKAVDMLSNKIVNLSDPTNTSDAVNKKYVDEQILTRLPLAGGRMEGLLDMNTFKIINLPNPTRDYDTTTKYYVDSQISTRLSLNGGTMNGVLDMNDFRIIHVCEPLDNEDAATKHYVDSKHDTQLSLAGGVMNGVISMNLYPIENLGNPVQPQDAVTKSYADTSIQNQGYLHTNGDNMMVGDLNMGTLRVKNMSNPIDMQDGVTKSYMLNETSKYLPLTGGNMVGSINMNNNTISNVPTPNGPLEVVNKNYVDTWQAPVVIKNASFVLDSTYIDKVIQLSGAGIVVTLSPGVVSGNVFKLMQTDGNVSTITGLSVGATVNPNQAGGVSSIQPGVMYTVVVNGAGKFIQRQLLGALPHFWVYNPNSYTVGSGFWNVLPATGVKTNIGSGFNTGTSRFTAPFEGLYKFNTSFSSASPPNGCDIILGFLDGTNAEYYRGARFRSSTASFGINAQLMIYLQKGASVASAMYSTLSINSESSTGAYGIVFQGSLVYPG